MTSLILNNEDGAFSAHFDKILPLQIYLAVL